MNLYFIWPDGTWCGYEDLAELSHMSNDYEVFEVLAEDIIIGAGAVGRWINNRFRKALANEPQ